MRALFLIKIKVLHHNYTFTPYLIIIIDLHLHKFNSPTALLLNFITSLKLLVPNEPKSLKSPHQTHTLYSLYSTHGPICTVHCLKSFLNHSRGKEKVGKYRFDWITPEKKHNIDIHILNRSFNIRPQLHTIPASSTHHILQWNQWTRLHIAQMSFCSTLITTIWVRNFILLDFSKNLNIDSLNQTVSIPRGYSAMTYIYRDLIRIHASNIDQDSRWDYKSRLGKNHVKSVIFRIVPFHFCWR